ncbi:MAG: hypothetical protein IPL73_07485 [Candidatus Obscuribacter sp.]|nr:hypothetical protein [Candidatus Obscuribacter sp.]
MAPEAENQEELTLEKVDVAIKAVKADDHDLNPFTVARVLGIAPELLFESKEFMGRLIEARRKSQGDSATYSMDSELLLKVKNLEEEMAKLIDINQELYDRGSALEDQVITMETKITDLEQEAETLAMQLQNSWHLGYNKGLSDGKQKSEAKSEVVAATLDEPKIGHVTVEHEPIIMESETLTSKPQESKAAESEDEKSSSITEEQKPLELKAKEKDEDSAPVINEEITATGDQAVVDSQQAAAYNDRIYNVVHSSFMGNEKENYSSFSWKEIETVYQYSTVAGRPNINLYFEPFASAPSQNDEEEQIQAQPKEEESLAVLAAVKNNNEALPDHKNNINAKTGPLPAFQATEQKAEIEKMLAANQNETQPIPGAAAYFQAKEAAEKASKGYIKADELPDDGIDSPSSLFNDLSSNALTGGLLSHVDFGPPEPLTNQPETKAQMPAEPASPQNLRETSDSAPAIKSNDFETATFDSMDALKIDDRVDELDLDKMDMFEGLEDIDEIAQIEVIEDVVLPATEAASTKTTSETIDKSGATAGGAAVSGEDLRNLIKNRIKQADESQTLQAMPAPQAAGGDAALDNYGKIDADALKAGARNKFVGGKASTGGQDVAEAPAPALAAPRVVPPEIRKHCMILGVRPEELTVKIVVDAWKREMSQPGVHPDTGGDTETAIYLNNAKVELVKWIEAQAPKLGKKFGGQTGVKPQESGKPFIMGQKSDKKEPDKGPGKGSK